MKKVLIIIFCLFIFNNVFSQTSFFDSTSFFANSNLIYGNLDKTKITTGILREYGIDFINQDNFNGKTLHDSNWVNLTDWRVLYASLYSQQITNAANMAYLDTINNRMSRVSTNILPINLVGLDYYYQGLDTNAVTKNLIKIVGGKLYDVVNPPALESKETENISSIVNPKTAYKTYLAFAFATTQQFAYKGSNQFIFRTNLFFTNTSKTVNQIQIDPYGNGIYQTASFDIPFTINYADTGLIPMTVKITYTDGSINYSHTKIVVYNNPNTLVSRFGDRVTTNELITATKAHLGQFAKGDITIELALNNTTGQIRKPLIVVEGFDPDGSYVYRNPFGPDYIDNLNVDANTNIAINLNEGLDNINDYDMIFLHYANGTDFIQRNAYLLEEVLRIINIRKTTYNGVRQQNVITGLSMGGLVVRYALRDMELNNLVHETRLFISHDAPHWGANVPVAYQALVQHIAPWKIINITGPFPNFSISYQDLFPDAINARNLFNSPAARQMLIQRYLLVSPFPGSNQLVATNADHINFMNEINNMGWPTQCRNITLSNGSCNGSPQPFSAGSQLLSIYGSRDLGTYFGGLWRSLLITLGGTPLGLAATGGTIPINNLSALVQLPLSLITTKGTFYFDFAAWAVPNSGTPLIYQGDAYIKRQLFWGLLNTTSYVIKCHVNAKTDMLPLDNAPGGVYDLNQFGLSANTINSQLNNNSLTAFINATILQPRFCFVPTVSALAISNPLQNLSVPLCNNLECLKPSEVSDFYAPSTNQIHISYTQPSSDWILTNQSANNTCGRLCYNSYIIGNNLICNSSVYSIANLPSGATVSWSLSNNAGSTLLLSQNSPLLNSLTVTNQHFYDLATTLIATITISGPNNSCSNKIITKQISNDNATSSSLSFPFYQEACTAFNVSHTSITGYTNSPTFVHTGCWVYVNIGDYTSVTNTCTIPVLNWYVGSFSSGSIYYPHALGFQLPSNSGGIPFTFKLSRGVGGCFDQNLLFFAFSNNGKMSNDSISNYSYTLSPNPASEVLNVFANLKPNNGNSNTKGLNKEFQFSMNVFDFNTNSLIMMNQSKKGILQHQLNISKLKSGWYILQIIEGEKKESLKFFKP